MLIQTFNSSYKTTNTANVVRLCAVLHPALWRAVGTVGSAGNIAVVGTRAQGSRVPSSYPDGTYGTVHAGDQERQERQRRQKRR